MSAHLSAQTNMINSQLRPNGILNEKTLNTLRAVPREAFVPEAFSAVAYSEMPISLDQGDTMLSPLVEAKCIDALNIKGNETALVVGTGSGYLTALIAHQAQQVFSLDIRPDLIERANALFKARNLFNVTLSVQDGALGYADHAPYEVIVIAGGLPYLPTSFKSMLNVGGRLFAFLGEPGHYNATLITRGENNNWTVTPLFETDLPMLKHDLPKEQFDF